ncbi:hypothetical protein ES708_14340 [subsurface metagenome]
MPFWNITIKAPSVGEPTTVQFGIILPEISISFFTKAELLFKNPEVNSNLSCGKSSICFT